jgi:hypothetical protein
MRNLGVAIPAVESIPLTIKGVTSPIRTLVAVRCSGYLLQGFEHEIRNGPLPFIPILLMFNTACW